MSQSALLTKEAVNVSATEVFPEITVNGEVVPLVSGVTVVFTAENSWDLKVEVKAYPLPPSGYPNFYFRMFERWSGNDKVLYDILPAKRLWIDGKQVLKFNGVAYSAERSEIVLLEPAQDKWGARLITSPILYRTKGKSSNEGAARKFETVEVHHRKRLMRLPYGSFSIAGFIQRVEATTRFGRSVRSRTFPVRSPKKIAEALCLGYFLLRFTQEPNPSRFDNARQLVATAHCTLVFRVRSLIPTLIFSELMSE